MIDDPLLRVFDGGEKETSVGDEVSAVDAVEESPEVFEVPAEVVEEAPPVPKKKVARKKKKTTRGGAGRWEPAAMKAEPKPRKPKKFLGDGEVLTGSEIIAKRKCTIDDVHAACEAGKIVSVYEQCCDSGASQFKFKAV
jgi:hypothetical protein